MFHPRPYSFATIIKHLAPESNGLRKQRLTRYVENNLVLKIANCVVFRPVFPTILLFSSLCHLPIAKNKAGYLVRPFILMDVAYQLFFVQRSEFLELL